jgi:hypothetical protein
LRKPITGIAGCCACEVSGHDAAPASPAMNSRRLISALQRLAGKPTAIRHAMEPMADGSSWAVKSALRSEAAAGVVRFVLRA